LVYFDRVRLTKNQVGPGITTGEAVFSFNISIVRLLQKVGTMEMIKINSNYNTV